MCKRFAIFCSALLLVSHAAVASEAAPWSALSVISRENAQGEKVVNENLIPLIQDVNQAVTGNYLRIRVIDAVFDGRGLAVAYELENLSDDRHLYAHMGMMMDSAGGTQDFLAPGETINGRLDGPIRGHSGDTLHAFIHYDVFAPAAAFIGDPDFPHHIERQDMRFSEGERIVPSDKYEYLEEVMIEFDLRAAEKRISLLPGDEAIEIPYDDFTLRIVSADYTLGTLEAVFELLFDTEEAAAPYDSFDFILGLFDEEGERIQASWMRYFPIPEDDGVWVVKYHVWDDSRLLLPLLPKTLTICPAWRSNPEDSFAKPLYDRWEGITLPLRQ